MSEAKRPKRRATYQDVLDAPEHLVAEIVDGELYLSPRPAPRHANAEAGVLAGLRNPFDRSRGGPGGWRILNEPELHLGKDIVVPDIAGWHRDRMPTLPKTAYFSVAPDWLCEVLSPSTRKFDRTKKLRVYAREEVRHVWLVDARTRTLEILVRNGSEWSLHATHRGTDPIRAIPFDAIEIELGDLWD